MTKEVTKAENTAIATEMPSYLVDQMDNVVGNEEVESGDLVIPRVGIIQALSPQRKKTDAAYIDGAEEGMIFNNVSSELYGEEVQVVPVYFKKEYLLWVDRKAGGGFRGSYATESEAVMAKEADDDADNIDVADTAQNFVIIVRPDGTIDEAVISMSRSQLKVSRKWNSIIRMAGGPRFSRVYSLSAVEEQNANGDSYLNWGVKQVGFPSEEVFRKAEKLYEAVSSGEATVHRGDDASETIKEEEDY